MIILHSSFNVESNELQTIEITGSLILTNSHHGKVLECTGATGISIVGSSLRSDFSCLVIPTINTTVSINGGYTINDTNVQETRNFEYTKLFAIHRSVSNELDFVVTGFNITI